MKIYAIMEFVVPQMFSTFDNIKVIISKLFDMSQRYLVIRNNAVFLEFLDSIV